MTTRELSPFCKITQNTATPNSLEACLLHLQWLLWLEQVLKVPVLPVSFSQITVFILPAPTASNTAAYQVSFDHILRIWPCVLPLPTPICCPCSNKRDLLLTPKLQLLYHLFFNYFFTFLKQERWFQLQAFAYTVPFHWNTLPPLTHSPLIRAGFLLFLYFLLECDPGCHFPWTPG